MKLYTGKINITNKNCSYKLQGVALHCVPLSEREKEKDIGNNLPPSPDFFFPSISANT